jgi:hypothetical protein
MSYSAKSQEPASRQNANSFTPVSGALLQRKCACGGSSGLTGSCSECEQKKMLGLPLQTKLRINEPGDAYEQEADRMAERVMRMVEPSQDSDSWQHGATANVQRRIAGDGVENIQRQEEAPSASGKPRVERTRRRTAVVRVGVKIRRVSANVRRKITRETI